MPDIPDYQAQFHQQWGHLNDVHVRSLAWLLSSPDLLDQQSPVWQGAIVVPELPSQSQLEPWLSKLDAYPEPLHQALRDAPTKRLGLYAETLLAFFLADSGELFAHGLQVNDDHARTIGEFDFLVKEGAQLVHWELATKFYLFCSDAVSEQSGAPDLFNYLGPNLADTLGAKMKKIVQQQLRLSLHPAAKKLLPFPLLRSQALVKGWLFYRDIDIARAGAVVDGVSEQHCRGYIWTLRDLQEMSECEGVILARLTWLAPVQSRGDAVMEKQALLAQIKSHFSLSTAPVLLAITITRDGIAREVCRGMLVPDDWWDQARVARLRP